MYETDQRPKNRLSFFTAFNVAVNNFNESFCIFSYVEDNPGMLKVVIRKGDQLSDQL